MSKQSATNKYVETARNILDLFKQKENLRREKEALQRQAEINLNAQKETIAALQRRSEQGAPTADDEINQALVRRVEAKNEAQELIIRIGEKRKVVREAIGGILFVQSMVERINMSGGAMQGASLDIVKPEPSSDLIV